MRPQPPYRIFIGWDPSQLVAWNVAAHSACAHATHRPIVQRLALAELVADGLYTRPTRYPSAEQVGYYDEISEAPMATSHAIARFLVPALCHYEGWALFCDGDVLFRTDPAALFALADPCCAIQVVQHVHVPDSTTKMEGQAQTRYARKNWSSVMLLHCGHRQNRRLTPALVNALPGRDLHRFCWLNDDDIGALPSAWNHLVGVSPPDPDPALVHFTEGVPDMPGYEHCAFSDEWYAVAKRAGYRLPRPEAVA